MNIYEILIGLVLGLFGGIGGAFFVFKFFNKKQNNVYVPQKDLTVSNEEEFLKLKEDIISKAKEEANAIKKQAEAELKIAKEESLKIRDEAREEAKSYLTILKQEMYEKLEKDRALLREELEFKKRELEESISKKEEELRRREDLINQREAQLNKKWENLEKKEEDIYKREKELRNLEKQLSLSQKSLEDEKKAIEDLKKDINSLKEREILELQRIASLTMEEARREILQKAEEEAKLESIKIAKKIEDEAREAAQREAKRIIITAVQRLAPEIAINYSISTVELPSNEFKGRIIGREGRNIRTFEILTGVDVIIDDTPDIVTLSSFDPLRREIAKIALEKLIVDGRIHPARIEEVIEEVKKEMDERIRKLGEETVFELGIHDMNPGLYYYIGKLYYRTSYSQNVLLHSKEVANIAGLMAKELGLDEKMAKRAGLLHDIGKAISHEIGGSHTDIGIELCKKYGEPDPVLNAIKAHHEEEPVKYHEVGLVCAADALSAARPGARRESLETYLKRLEKLEEIVKSFEGVSNAYVVQAGREVRVMVSPEVMTDEQAYLLSKNIAKKIEEEMEYPGNIKVVVIREVRHIEYAR